MNKIQQGGTDVTTFDYDFNGNLTNKTDGLNTPTPTTTALSYDPLDQMVTASKSWEQPQSYQYDDQGRRISKSVGGKVTNYVYNGQDIIAEYTGTWNKAAASYTHGSGTDQPLIRTTGAATPISQYYHQDGLGSVTAVTDQTGATVGTARNDAWGNKLSGNGGIPQYGFTGREPGETGLIFYRGRYYDPTIGRFIQRDPIGMAGGMNLYAYVGNNPVNFTDPMGLFPQEIGTLNIETANILPYNSTTPGLDSANQSLAAVNGSSNLVSSANLAGSLFAANTFTDTATDAASFGVSVEPTTRLINPQPAGYGGPTITFRNDIPGGPSTNLPVSPVIAEVIENAVLATGLSININSTTGGDHVVGSLHPLNLAVDINRVGGNPVNGSNFDAQTFQHALEGSPGLRENFGPFMNKKVLPSGNQIDVPGVAAGHRTHIHVSGQ